MSADFAKFIEWAFYAVLSGGVLFASHFLQRISKDIAKLHADLNTIIERTAWHEKELAEHNGRLRDLESKRRRP